MFLELAVLVNAVLVTNALVLTNDNFRNVTQIITVTNGGPYGDWGNPQFCAVGSFAAGFDTKVENYQGGGDDTELNGIKLQCQALNSGGSTAEITSSVGDWGNWKGAQSCFSPHATQHFLTSFSLKVEPSQGNSDDTEANDVKFQCRDIDGLYLPFELPKQTVTTNFGVWGAWSNQCDKGSAICGISTRVEQSQGSGDDTALNDVKFYCCQNL